MAIVALVAIGLRLAFSLGIARGYLHIQPELESTDGYHLIAESLAEGHGYRFGPDDPLTLRRPPAYPLFVYSFLSSTTNAYWWVQVAQAVLGGVGCVLLFALGRWAHSAAVGLVAATLYAFYPNSILYSARLYSENLYFPLLLASTYFLCRASIEGSMRRGLLAGVLWAGGLLTRGTLLLLPLVMPFVIAVSAKHRSPAGRWLRWAVPAVIAGVLVLSPWIARNYKLTGAIVPVSSWAWGPLYQGTQVAKHMTEWRNLGDLDLDAGRAIRDTVERRLNRQGSALLTHPADEIGYEAIAREMVLADWRADPIGLVVRAATGLVFTWFFTYDVPMRLFSLLLHAALAGLFITGAVMMARKEPEAFARLWPALAVILFVNAFYGIAYPHVRYMAPAIALSMIYAAVPLLAIAGRLARRYRPIG